MQILHQAATSCRSGRPSHAVFPRHGTLRRLARLVHSLWDSSERSTTNMGKNTSVIGIYEDRTTIADALEVLHKAGYRAADISVLTSDNHGSKDCAHEKHTKAPAGAVAGAAVGAVAGAVLALLDSNQVVAIAGLGPLVAAGPWLAALARSEEHTSELQSL